MSTVRQLAAVVGVVAACAALGVSRATFYRSTNRTETTAGTRTSPPRALTAGERARALDVLNSERFCDASPAEIYATLLDEGEYICSERTFCRILQEEYQIRERRNQLRHPAYVKPELLATGPRQVWTWDITKLRTQRKWEYLFLYVLLDIYSRYVVGWMVAEHENAEHAKRLIAETCRKEDIREGTLTIHSDRGAPMMSKTLAQLLADLAITKSHSRPHVSNDNPFSESQFKTLKYWPGFPGRFSSIFHATTFLREFFEWYNLRHPHEGIAMLTPAVVHSGRAQDVLEARQAVLDKAYREHPERFVRQRPVVGELPEAVFINPPPKPSPSADETTQTETTQPENLATGRSETEELQ